MSTTTVTLLDARWRLHVAEDREASHQVRCRSGCKPGASTCDTGRALTAEVVEAMCVVEMCAQPDEATAA
jgi:hypothetical protein